MAISVLDNRDSRIRITAQIHNVGIGEWLSWINFPKK